VASFLCKESGGGDRREMEEIPVSMTTDGQCYFLVHYASEFFLW
jgi:hypothetical protein